MKYCSSCGHRQDSLTAKVCQNPKCAKSLNNIFAVGSSTGEKNIPKLSKPSKTIRRGQKPKDEDYGDDYEDDDDDDESSSSRRDPDGSDVDRVPRIKRIDIECNGIFGSKDGSSVGGISRKFKLGDLIPKQND